MPAYPSVRQFRLGAIRPVVGCTPVARRLVRAEQLAHARRRGPPALCGARGGRAQRGGPLARARRGMATRSFEALRFKIRDRTHVLLRSSYIKLVTYLIRITIRKHV